MISPGARLALDFPVKIVRGRAIEEVRFRDLLTRRTFVSVHLKNKTPSCDRQTASLAAHADEFERAGYNLVAISRDTSGSHLRRAAVLGRNFTLVSDPDDQFARATASLIEKSMYGRTFIGPQRAAYLLDRDGTVLAVVEKVDTADHASQLRALLKPL